MYSMPKSYVATLVKEVNVSRFQLGQKVVITGSITTKHRDREAMVINVQPSRHSKPGVTSLDKYVVRFEDGDQVEFYDIQLMAARPGKEAPRCQAVRP
jgi:hypothetical protein